MGSTVKFGAPAKQLLCCISKDVPRERETDAPKYFSCNRTFQGSQKQQTKRESAFAQRKAERASMRAHLREKYQLPKNRTDRKQLEAAGGKTKLPQDLLAIVKPKDTSEPGSIFSAWAGLDFSSLRITAESAVESLKRPVQCPVM
ncbi:complexin-3-like [Anolis sagrei]|uniref:complexin-3-like n=1 Tax=Anolis sagrei TaxID=38937 RepID=UPI00295B0C4A|nr:complexin-3-like [Anolis sagrei ordinatus]